MAKKQDKQISGLRSISNLITNLAELSKTTNYNTYKTGKDLFTTERILSKIDELQKKNEESIKNTIDGNTYANSRLNGFGLLTGQDRMSNKKLTGMNGDARKLFDVINQDNTVFAELKQHLLLNNKFYETIGDYELLRRAIPEISRVINLLINSVIIPEVISSDIYNLSYLFKNKASEEISKRLRDKYEIDKKIRIMVENYFVIGVEYITVIPYKAIIEAIKADNFSHSSKKTMLKESSLDIGTNKFTLTESVFVDILENSIQKIVDNPNGKKTIPLKTAFENTNIDVRIKELNQFNTDTNKYINSINVYKSNKRLIYEAALVEAASTEATYMFESSFDEQLSKKLKSPKRTDSSDGLNVIDNKEYDKIKANGCKIERLDPARVWPLKIKDTVIAYVYLEERRDEALQYNLHHNMRNSFSFYRMNSLTSNEYNLKMLEDRMIKEIGGRILHNLSPKFIETNFDDMDIFYEFLRDNHIHRVRKDIILLHPDDVIEFKRAEGSLMKNAVFFAKLYLLMVINNILIKVRRGSDRTLYYVDNGLTNDIEGSVMEAIEAIQQSQIRFSDIGTITGIIGAVGSTVDVFIPQSSDGNKPINSEIISGQQVDMDEEFLKYLIKSIILSFNVPSVVVDFTNEVEFARTLSMANLDVATSSALAQAELNIPLTELFKRVMAYDQDLTKEEIDSIKATLIPSRSMLMQITSDLISTTKGLGESMADINIIEDDDKSKKLFVKEFVRTYFNYDWGTIDKLLIKIKEKLIENKLETDVKEATDSTAPTNDTGGDTGGTEY